MYSKIVLEHFQNPHNQGSIPDASGVGEVGNPVCGDIMKIYLKIKSDGSQNIDNHIIEDVKFETLGCGAAIASTSMLTDLIKGKKVGESLKITRQNGAETSPQSSKGVPELWTEGPVFSF